MRERLKYREGDMVASGTKSGEKGGESLLSRSNGWRKGLASNTEAYSKQLKVVVGREGQTKQY